jgi:sigma-B regulation protein RsbQ
MNVIERNNIKISGHGSKPIIFAHGYGCDQRIWTSVAPAFEADYEVVLIDHVGAGGSDLSKYDRTRYSTLQGYADDIVEIGEALDITGGVFVGHSVSTMIGLLASIKNPKLFDRIVLIGPSPCYFNEAGYDGGFSYEAINQMLQQVDSNYESWSKTMVPIIMGNSDRPELSEQLVETFCQNQPDIARHFAHVTFLADHRKDLHRVEVPSLILQCSEDSIAPTSVGEYLSRNLKNSKLKALKATGHCPHVSEPKETIESIHEYLSLWSNPTLHSVEAKIVSDMRMQ